METLCKRCVNVKEPKNLIAKKEFLNVKMKRSRNANKTYENNCMILYIQTHISFITSTSINKEMECIFLRDGSDEPTMNLKYDVIHNLHNNIFLYLHIYD